MIVQTGFGYIKNADGNITDKYVLPLGEHPLKDGYTQYEVADQAELDSVVLYEDPKVKEEVAVEALIQKKMRELAVSTLKTEGVLDAQGKIKEK